MTDGLSDPIRDFLRRSGAPYPIIASGLRGLVTNWERVVDLIVAGYPQGLDDYLNDMDSRQLLENALELAPGELRDEVLPRVWDADRRLRPHLVPAGRCLWGGIVADEEGWDPEQQWWYYERPSNPGPALREELEADGPRG